MSNSCESCPSFVKAADTGSVLAKPVDLDVCVRFGHILSKPGASASADARIKSSIAGECPSYGQPRPATVPEYLTAQVSMGDPIAISVSVTRAPRTDAEAPSSCTGCEYFVPPNVVRQELGWQQGLCAMKGRLLWPNRYLKEAQGCAEGRIGEKRDTADGIMLLKAYDASMAAAVKLRRTTAPIDSAAHRTDPRQYVTDKPLDADDVALNIRAWRQVDDPEGIHEPVYLPIFDGIKLTGSDPRATYGNHRPDLYIDHAGLLYDLAGEMYEDGNSPILVGPAGTGKTEMGVWLAWLMDLPVTRLSMHAETEVEDFIGHPTLTESNGATITGYEKGSFIEAIEKPGVVIVDEYNVAGDAIQQFLRPIFDGAGEIALTKNGSAVAVRHPFCFPMGTQNPDWDPIYVGTKTLSAADLDRVSGIALGLPPESIERQIITERCADSGYDIDPVVLDKVMQVAQDIRRQITEGTLMMAWGIRSNIDVALKTRRYSFEKAYRRAILDLLEPESADIIVASVRTVA